MLELLWRQTALALHAAENPFVFGILIIAFTLAIFRWRKDAAVLFFFSVGGALLANYSLKLLFALPRPEDMLVTAVTPYGFPSSHAAVAAAAALALWWHFGRTAKTRVISVGTALVAAGVVATVAASRLSLQVHILPDVIAGAAVGVGVTLAINWLALRKS